MKVTLIKSYDNFHTDLEFVPKLAASICMGRDYISETGYNNAIKSNHLSLLEHIHFTFLIENVSRVTEVQLVRHRIASYSIQSARVSPPSNGMWYIMPDTVNKGFITRLIAKVVSSISLFSYNLLVWLGIPKEDARYFLIQGKSTKILVSMNARAFVEQCEKRLCNKAQWEIREVFNHMKEAIKEFPTAYELCNPPCKKQGCRELKPCNK